MLIDTDHLGCSSSTVLVLPLSNMLVYVSSEAVCTRSKDQSIVPSIDLTDFSQFWRTTEDFVLWRRQNKPQADSRLA